ncbi:hypothetical protein [Polyangium fumosum]|uniref:hypothetical protein n=1 Tax=Polyangium fumosum TaxID=889272 RepID=UPI001478E78F|nr:hypothetical protein [Polyangium fumosum]
MAAASGDVEAAAVAHDAAESLLALLSHAADESTAAARAAHDAVGKLLGAKKRR